MLSFADTFGYCFRKRLALAIHADALEAQKAARMKHVDDEVRQRPWTGDGQFDRLRDECPFDFSVWSYLRSGEKTKIRATMDVSRIAGTIWDAVGDVWLKTSMLTFNRAFPYEINRFIPKPRDDTDLFNHHKLARMMGLGEQFADALVAGMKEATERAVAAKVIESLPSRAYR